MTMYRIQIGPNSRLEWLEKNCKVPVGTNGAIVEISAGNYAGTAITEAVAGRDLCGLKLQRDLEKMCSVLEVTEPKPKALRAPTEFLGQPVLATVEYRTQLELSWYVIIKGDPYFEAYSPSGGRCGIGRTLESAIAAARSDASGNGGGIGYHDLEA